MANPTNAINVWNGSSWVGVGNGLTPNAAKMWNGSSWQAIDTKVWNGKTFYNALDIKAITVGSSTLYGYSGYITYTGYSSVGVSPGTGYGPFGSISSATFGVYNAPIVNLYMSNLSGGYLLFTVSGTVANSGWETMTFNGISYSRSSAGFTQASGQTNWQWTIYGNNSMGNNGDLVTVAWK